MANASFNRAWMTVSGAPGSGTITLNAAVPGYQVFGTGGADVPNSTVIDYVAIDGTAWEIGTGTYTQSGTTLSRTLIASSTGSLLSLSSAATVFIAPNASDMITNGGANTLGIANGGTGQSTFVQALSALEGGATSTATAAGTTTLSNTSALNQIFTGTSTQTVKLPDVTTIPLGTTYYIDNESTGALTIQTSSATALYTIPAVSSAAFTSIQTSGNTAASWNIDFFPTYPLGVSNLPSGSWNLLNTLTASASASLSDTTSFTSSYQTYALVLQNLLPATTNTNLQLTLQSGGSFQATSYAGNSAWSNSGTVWTAGAVNSTFISVVGAGRVGNNASGGIDGILYLPNPAQTAAYKQIWGNGTFWDSAASGLDGWLMYAAWRGGTGAITGVQFAMASGNIASGTIKIYGIKA